MLKGMKLIQEIEFEYTCAEEAPQTIRYFPELNTLLIVTVEGTIKVYKDWDLLKEYPILEGPMYRTSEVIESPYKIRESYIYGDQIITSLYDLRSPKNPTTTKTPLLHDQSILTIINGSIYQLALNDERLILSTIDPEEVIFNVDVGGIVDRNNVILGHKDINDCGLEDVVFLFLWYVQDSYVLCQRHQNRLECRKLNPGIGFQEPHIYEDITGTIIPYTVIANIPVKVFPNSIVSHDDQQIYHSSQSIDGIYDASNGYVALINREDGKLAILEKV